MLQIVWIFFKLVIWYGQLYEIKKTIIVIFLSENCVISCLLYIYAYWQCKLFILMHKRRYTVIKNLYDWNICVIMMLLVTVYHTGNNLIMLYFMRDSYMVLYTNFNVHFAFWEYYFKLNYKVVFLLFHLLFLYVICLHYNQTDSDRCGDCA